MKNGKEEEEEILKAKKLFADIEDKYIIPINQPTTEEPIIIENSPYSFQTRTLKKMWIETNDRGQRVITQTLNPKTKKWNKPKRSIYADIMIIGKSKLTGYYSCILPLTNYNTYETYKEFLNFVKRNNILLSSKILESIKVILAYKKAYSFASYSITENTTEKEQEEINQSGIKIHEELKKLATKFYNEDKI